MSMIKDHSYEDPFLFDLIDPLIHYNWSLIESLNMDNHNWEDPKLEFAIR